MHRCEAEIAVRLDVVHGAPCQKVRPVYENARDQRTRATSGETLMSTYLITGIAGFIGRHWQELCCSEGTECEESTTSRPANQ